MTEEKPKAIYREILDQNRIRVVQRLSDGAFFVQRENDYVQLHNTFLVKGLEALATEKEIWGDLEPA